MAYQALGLGYFRIKVWGNALTIGLSSFYWGFYIGVLSTSTDYIAETLGWGSTEKFVLVPLISALFPLGAIFGALLFGGAFSKNLGRRKVLMYASLFGIIASSIHAIPYTASFAIGRFMCGVAGGVMSTVPSIFITEISPPDLSGRTGMVIQLMVTTAIFISMLLGLALPVNPSHSNPMNDWWIFMILFPIIPTTLQLFLFVFVYKHEPASWLIERGDVRKASMSARFFYNEEHAQTLVIKLNREYAKKEYDESKSSSSQTHIDNPTFCDLLKFSGVYKQMMVLGVGLQFLQQLSGVNAIINYSQMIFEEYNDKNRMRVRLFICGFGAVNMAATCLGFPFVDRFGRRPLLVIGEAAMLSAHLMIALLTVYQADELTIVILTFIFIVAFEISLGPVVWLYCGEIMNDKGMSIAVACNWSCAFVVELTFSFLQLGGDYIPYFIYSFICLGGLVFTLLYVKETKGRSKEDIKKYIMRPYGFN